MSIQNTATQKTVIQKMFCFKKVLQQFTGSVKKATILMVLVSTTAFAANSSDRNNPYIEMQSAADKVFTTIKTQSAKIKADPNRLKEIVKEDLLQYVQVKYSAALVLGNYYKSASEAQRTAYFAAFEDYLVQAFAQALSMYKGQPYQVESAKDIGNKTFLSIRVLLKQSDTAQPLRIDFLWRKNTVTGEWKAYDLVAEGVSMITTKQNEWATILRQGGIDALTKELNSQAKQNIDPNKQPEKNQ
ncbi:phospholipid-binding protein MlaC [Orbaceae bacterium ESL0721]|nr:phospholipid-binding protein MlaC [Orbaceae bacterium ESL0721]